MRMSLIHAGKGWKNAIVTWYQKFKESVFFRKLFLLAFVTSMILFRTLLNRNLWMNPLSDVMGGWGILPLESNDSKKNRRHNVHKHLAAVLCIIPNKNGGYEAEPQPLLGSLWGIP